MDELPICVQDFLTYMHTILGKSPRTVDEYALDLRMFLRFLCVHKGLYPKDAPPDEIDISQLDREFFGRITLSDLFAFLSFLARDKGDIASTRARKVSCLRTFFKYLTTKARVISQNPAEFLESPKIKASLPVYLSLDESLQLLDNVDGPNKERDYAILTLFLNCGMRLSELCGINWADIRDDNTVRLLGKGNKERTVYLNSACLDAVAAYKKVRPVDGVHDKNALFLSSRGQRISVKTVQWLVKKHISAAGLDGRNYSTHKLRHTAATLMFREGGVDVRTLQEILGHAQLTTTQIYTHVSNEQIREATDRNPLAKVKAKKRAVVPKVETARDDEDQ